MLLKAGFPCPYVFTNNLNLSSDSFVINCCFFNKKTIEQRSLFRSFSCSEILRYPVTYVAILHFTAAWNVQDSNTSATGVLVP